MSVKYFKITARTPFACEELIDYAEFENNAAGALLLDELCDIRCLENADNWYNCHSYDLEGFETEEEYYQWYYSQCDVLLEEITYEEYMYEKD